MPSTVVILGGAYGGLHVAHYLLKYNNDVKVILVSKVCFLHSSPCFFKRLFAFESF